MGSAEGVGTSEGVGSPGGIPGGGRGGEGLFSWETEREEKIIYSITTIRAVGRF